MRDAVRISPLAAKPLPQKPFRATESDQTERLVKGTWFRSEIDLREPEGSGLTTAILGQIASVESRARALRAVDAINRFQLVRRIAANALACQYHRELPHVAYRATAAFYWNDPRWLNGASMSRTANLLNECGLVSLSAGEWGRVSSIYTPTERLLKLAAEFGVDGASIVETVPVERLVRLRESNADGPEMQFKVNKETEAWSDQLEAYNRFVEQHDLTVDVARLSIAEWLDKLNDQKSSSGLPLRAPELFRRSLHRTFNNGTFDQGGRLYGSWWTNAPKGIRPGIRINGEETVEYDYSGCAIRMLYHEREIDYRDDPYRIEPLWNFAREEGLIEDHFREAVKALMQALINSQPGVNPARARMYGASLQPFSRRAVIAMIEKKHSEIADAFASGAGLRLQKKESDIALSIIVRLMDKGVLALPIHDSFRVGEQYGQQLIEEMDSCYLNSLGFHPLIKLEG